LLSALSWNVVTTEAGVLHSPLGTPPSSKGMYHCNAASHFLHLRSCFPSCILSSVSAEPLCSNCCIKFLIASVYIRADWLSFSRSIYPDVNHFCRFCRIRSYSRFRRRSGLTSEPWFAKAAINTKAEFQYTVCSLATQSPVLLV